jgi:hypothetical protein
MITPTYVFTGNDLQNMPQLPMNYRSNVQVAQTIGCLEIRDAFLKYWCIPR